MTPAEFLASLDRLGLSQAELARLFGHALRSSYHWSAGERRIPPIVGVTLRLMVVQKITRADIILARQPLL